MDDLNFFYNVEYSFAGITLFLDIDKKNEVIKNAFFKAEKTHSLYADLDSHCKKIVNLTLDEYDHLLSEEKKQTTNLLNVPRWITKHAIAKYRGDAARLKSSNDLLCLCFGVTKREIQKNIVNDQNFDLTKLIQTTMATSACGSCTNKIKEEMEKVRSQFSIVYGKGKTRSAFDKDGHWIKINHMYPAELLIKLDELYKEWVQKEEIAAICHLEIIDIEGHYIDFKSDLSDQKKAATFLVAFNEYAVDKMGASLYFSLL